MNIKPTVTEDTTVAPSRVAGVQQLLVALADPVRLEMVRRLVNAGSPMPCALLYDGINKSTATHHFKALREAGLTERLVIDGHTHQRLRVDQVEEAVPGLLASIVGGVNREVTSRAGS
ncbi:helix-turn-helix transcriptional regulator [Mycolicibacterium sp.]|uniref:ArsR/SmtB family transcription factor n=1 Tax=Mycolicibacterium sp. TaxID=2320850 RepID=UPI001A1E389E|nr:helix-turn-helix transcriptional regulator [Mycolicibacterium sp.]MBJ7338500.1 helix-turn-helix transcriptional regulator [Mycolicibacterium sp.]